MRTSFGLNVREPDRDKPQSSLKDAKSHLLLLFALFCIGTVPAWALDPNVLPAGNFDLSHWYLTLPDSSATIIEPSELVAGYTNAVWFYTGADGAMVFWAPVTGGSTVNSTFPRSELRERLDPDRNDVNWTAYGTHILDAQCKVTQLPSTGKVIIGQIHSYLGDARPLVKLVYDNGAIDAQVKESPTAATDKHFSFSSEGLNALITYQIKVVDGLVSMTINGTTQSVDAFQLDPEWANETFYFKAGSYCQDNSGTSSEGARVEFYYLKASHPGPSQIPPSITSQPISRTGDEGATVSFSVTAVGATPLSYQWRKDEVELPDATNTSFTIPSVQTNDPGNYTVVITNAVGSVTSAVARLTVSRQVTLAKALDTTNLVWTTNGSPPWFGQTDVSHDGEDAAQSGAIGHGASTSMKTTVTGPGAVSFWWKVSSEPNNDRLRFYVNGSEQARISGEVGWEFRTFDLASGSQALEWKYSKNSSTLGGQDRGWVDQVRFGPSPPVITRQPISQRVDGGATVGFNVAATGTPPLSYQWWLDGAALVDGGVVRGATTPTLTLSNIPLTQAGSYWVEVSNAAATVTSSNALLTVNPVVPLAEALDTQSLVWTTSGSPAWVGQTNLTHDGIDAARSGAIGDGKTTTMQTTVTGPGTVSFWWKVSSEPSNDRLLFYVGSSEKARISGEVDWQWRTFNVSSGNQVLKWTYSKNSSKAGGQDRGWVDEVLFIPSSVPTAPIIAVQPASQSVEAQTTVSFYVGAIGSLPLTYQWQLNGTNVINGGSVSGANSATLTLANVQPTQGGTYSVVLSNVAGVVASSNAVLAVAPLVPLAEALDTPSLVWTTSGSPPWVGQTNVTHDGFHAARSGAIADGQSASMQTTVTGPGTMSFWWKVSSEPINDKLRFYVNGSEQARITGEVGWEQRTFTLSSGSQVLQWKYSKNSSGASGQDRGWVDQVEFIPSAVPRLLPAATFAPSIVALIAIAGGTMVLTWEATPGKTYSVFYKDSLSDTEWNPLGIEVIVTNLVASVEDAVEGRAQRFYQVREE